MTVDLPSGPAWLFCPADRPERFTKAATAADVVIIDLEDGVSPPARPSARDALARESDALDPDRTVIRISPHGTADHQQDLALLARLPFEMVMLSKAESAAQLRGLDDFSVVALCETPAGVRSAGEIAARDNCAALMWGAEDLIAALGGLSSRDETGRYRGVAIHARNEVLLAAGAAGTAVLDSVYLDIADLDGLRRESADAVASGFTAKACIHPAQVAVVRDAFRPAPAEFDWAEHVLAAVERNPTGVFALNGQMIDEPLIKQARRIVARSLAKPTRTT